MHYVKDGAKHTVIRDSRGGVHIFNSPSKELLANFLGAGEETRIKMCKIVYHGGETQLSLGTGIMYTNPSVGWNPISIRPADCKVGNRWTNVFDLTGFCNIDIVAFSLEEYKKINRDDFLGLFIDYCLEHEEEVPFDYVS